MLNALRRLVPRPLRVRVKDELEAAIRRSTERTSLEVEQRWRLLQTRVTDVETCLQQLMALIEQEQPNLLPPPKHLQIRVVGAYVPRFVESGYLICGDLNAVLQAAGKTLGDFPRILDFGCGCGRTTRALKTLFPDCDVHATDIDPEAIGWLTANWGRFADYRVAPHLPPTSFADDFFDLVVGISVFTHLPEDMQFRWLEELKRITKPGGYLVLTISGENNYKRLPPDLQKIMKTKGFYYSDAGYGQSISLPDFYQNTFHAHPYIQREWSKYFEVVDIQAVRVQNDQDTILLRKRS